MKPRRIVKSFASLSKQPLRSIRRGAIWCIVQSGLIEAKRKLTGRRDFILTFHRVRPEGQKLDAFDTCPSISISLFRQTLEYVKSRYTLVSLKELVDCPASAAARAAITFDDGWRDNYDIAYPILRELDIPAIIFVATGKIGSSEYFWQQKLGNLFRQTANDLADVLGRELRRAFALGTNEPLNGNMYKLAVLRGKRMSFAKLESILDRLAKYNRDQPNVNRVFLSETEILEMSRNGVDFGSHTVNHFILSQQTRTIIDQELSESKIRLECLLGKPIDAVAYPNGDMTDEVLLSAKTIGYRIGCSTERGMVTRNFDALRLPRIEQPWDFDEKREVFSGPSLEWLCS
jgi:peptidoglycan/xylan/chitin deacetylase (PgdA/CDA1 family)